MEESNSSTLTALDVEKSFSGAAGTVDVLRGVSFELGTDDSLAITGPSGSGKSTLLHLLGTLDEPTGGRIEIDGVCPHELDEADLAAFRNRRVGFVFQDHHLLSQYSVLENVLVPSMAPGADRAGAEDRAHELLRRVGLAERLHHRPAELSGGESQRVAVARALIHEPTLLLCDEPTGNLDHRTADSVADLLFELHAAERSILVVVTHSLDLAGRFSRRFELLDGRCHEL